MEVPQLAIGSEVHRGEQGSVGRFSTKIRRGGSVKGVCPFLELDSLVGEDQFLALQKMSETVSVALNP
jgi:hypothetical protein